MFAVAIESKPISPEALTAAFAIDPQSTGAVSSFTGYVRGEGISAMALEHYPGMTELSIRDTLGSASRRWPLKSAQVVHRVGELRPGDPIVWVAVAAAHRAAAFGACEFIMDYLKVSAPLWKREKNLQGDWHWIDAKLQDHRRARRWGLDGASKGVLA